MSSIVEKIFIKLVEGLGHSIKKTKPETSHKKGTVLLGRGAHLYRPREIENIYVAVQELLEHLYIVGGSGSGKSRLLLSIIKQLYLNGHGLAVIDVHGDLFQHILHFITDYLQTLSVQGRNWFINKRLYIIDPSVSEWTVGFNPLETTWVDPYTQAAEFISIFKNLWGDINWGPRTAELLHNVLLTLSLNKLTLLEAKSLLAEAPFRENLIKNLPEGEAKEYWYRYNGLSEKMQAVYREPILNRLSIFLSAPTIRAMVGQVKSTINFREVMDNRGILLINLPKGKLKGNADLLGSLIISKLQFAAQSRIDIPEERRIPFHVIVDEFQNFAGNDFETILSESRKFGLGLIVAHQNTDQLHRQLKATILGNTRSQIYFRLSHQDASTLASEISPQQKTIIQRRLIDLKTRETYVKKKGEQPRLMKTVYVHPAKSTPETVETIKQLSYRAHCRLRKEVENEITQRTKSARGEFLNPKGFIKTDPVTGRFSPSGKFDEAEEW